MTTSMWLSSFSVFMAVLSIWLSHRYRKWAKADRDAAYKDRMKAAQHYADSLRLTQEWYRRRQSQASASKTPDHDGEFFVGDC